MFTVVGLIDVVSRHQFETPGVQNVWETALMLDYITMVGLSPILVPLMPGWRVLPTRDRIATGLELLATQKVGAYQIDGVKIRIRAKHAA